MYKGLLDTWQLDIDLSASRFQVQLKPNLLKLFALKKTHKGHNVSKQSKQQDFTVWEIPTFKVYFANAFILMGADGMPDVWLNSHRQVIDAM